MDKTSAQNKAIHAKSTEPSGSHVDSFKHYKRGDKMFVHHESGEKLKGTFQSMTKGIWGKGKKSEHTLGLDHEKGTYHMPIRHVVKHFKIK